MFAFQRVAENIIMHDSLICPFYNFIRLLLSTCCMQETTLNISRTMLKKSDMIPFLVEFMISWGKESKQRMRPLQQLMY